MILMNRSIVLAQILSNGIMKEKFDYNYLGIEALMACYNECDYYVDQQNEYFWKNIGVVRDFLAENMPEVKMIEPEGTYLLWIDFSAWNMEQDDLMNAFAEAQCAPEQWNKLRRMRKRICSSERSNTDSCIKERSGLH